MYPLAMAMLFSGLCALASLVFPSPDLREEAALARGEELMLVCQAARDALAEQDGQESETVAPMGREEIVRHLPPGFQGLDSVDWKLAYLDDAVVVFLERTGDGARFPEGSSATRGVCRKGRLNDMVLPASVPEGALVCVARGR